MDIKDFLSPDHVLVRVRAPDKTGLIRDLARQAGAWLGISGDHIADALLQREALGSTGTGGGIAIPHARLVDVHKPFGVLVRLERAIDFEAIDGKPVRLLFLLLLPAAPSADQLTALASVSRRFRDPKTLDRMQRASGSDALYRAIL